MPVKEPPYDIGDKLTGKITFRDADDAVQDPATQVAKIYCPDKTVVEPFLTRASKGVYTFDYIVANGSGRYKVQGQGQGAIDIVSEPMHFDVRTPPS